MAKQHATERVAEISRQTRETKIRLRLDLAQLHARARHRRLRTSPDAYRRRFTTTGRNNP